jgi:hypothetical protein
MTLFSGYLSYKVVLAVFDNFFLEGWPAIFRLALAILKIHQEEFLKLSELTLVAAKV